MENPESKNLTRYTLVASSFLGGIFVFVSLISGLNKWPQLIGPVVLIIIAFFISYPVALIKCFKHGYPNSVLIGFLFAVLGIVWVLMCFLILFLLMIDWSTTFEMRL